MPVFSLTQHPRVKSKNLDLASGRGKINFLVVQSLSQGKHKGEFGICAV